MMTATTSPHRATRATAAMIRERPDSPRPARLADPAGRTGPSEPSGDGASFMTEPFPSQNRPAVSSWLGAVRHDGLDPAARSADVTSVEPSTGPPDPAVGLSRTGAEGSRTTSRSHLSGDGGRLSPSCADRAK